MQENLAMQESPAWTQENLVHTLPRMESIHARIKRLREAQNLSMEELARKVGVKAWQTVQQWENGTSAPKRARQAAVAEALGVTAHELVFGTGTASPEETIPSHSDDAELKGQEGAFYRGDIPALPLHDLPIITAEQIMQGQAELDRRFIWVAEDDHMAAGRMPSPRGYYVLIDPTAQHLLNDVVLARFPGRRPVLRRITEAGDAEYLVTESGELPAVRVEGGCEILGVAITSFPRPIERPPKRTD